MSEILLAGASGLIGSNLIKKFKQRNYKIVLLSTQKNNCNGIDTLFWDPENGIFPDLDLNRFSACYNFCGAGIFDKEFTDKRKLILTESRIKPIKFLQENFAKQNVIIPNFISASASGFYPNICLNELKEDSTSGKGFISELVNTWEHAAQEFKQQAKAVAIVRIGIVLSNKGGFLEKLITPMKFFAGAIPGSGKQICSWIHIDDLCDLFIFLFENNISGTFNGVAPKPESIEKISKQAATCIHRPILLPNIPVFMLRLIFGKERHELLLCDQNISSKKTQDLGFKFKYTDSETAIKDLLQHG
jgi:uncharacterized protein (TIGR01777 family)